MALEPERIVLDLPAAGYRDALRRLLGTHFQDPERLEQVLARLSESEEEFSSEVREGVVLPHALEHGLDRPLMFLGVAPEGIRFPHPAVPARLVFLLLGPMERRHDHLRLLTRIARVLRASDDLDELMEAGDIETVSRWFNRHREPGEPSAAAIRPT